MSIAETEQEIIEEFALFEDDWESKYEHLIDLGKSLPIIDASFKTKNALIQGCQSQVWLRSELAEGKVIYTADSDAIITKGLVALMVRVLSHNSPEEIIEAKMDFIDRIGLREHLSPTRNNGLLSMIKQMKFDAMALQKESNNGSNN
jgi:cysteine desulfuration protein SufE